MSAKSRGNWQTGICLKDCTHKGNEAVCGGCVRFSNLNAKIPEITRMAVSFDSIKTYGKESKRFYPHYNNAFGKYISTKGEYLSEMKKGGFVPYTGEATKNTRKEYKESDWARSMNRHIIHTTDSKGQAHVSSTFRNELAKRGVLLQNSNTKQEVSYDTSKGGWG
jgi:hypothetical protein